MQKNDILKRLNAEFASELRQAGFKRLIVAVSGGADSVALLSLLHNAGIDILAAHCNFHLRGAESNRDEQFVRNICAQMNVRLEVIDFDVESYLTNNPAESTEMACRNLRYEWFFSLLGKYQAQRVVTAHNADDNAETLFLNLLRGSGTTGLRGMLPDNGKVWRPLLSTSKAELLEYLAAAGLHYVTDSSNLESDYRRNFLRNEVIPLLKTRWKGFDKAISRTISAIRAENSIVEKNIAESLPPAGTPLSEEVALSFPAPELLVRRFISPIGPFSTTAAEVVEAMRAQKPDIKRWKLRNGSLELRNGKLFLKKDV